ncbi:hypothetical protein P9112_000128 [Eukaryota sp. TZLM1-RC]
MRLNHLFIVLLLGYVAGFQHSLLIDWKLVSEIDEAPPPNSFQLGGYSGTHSLVYAEPAFLEWLETHNLRFSKKLSGFNLVESKGFISNCDALTELSEPNGSFTSAGVADCTWKMPLEESHLIELHVTDIELQEGDYVDINWKWRDNHYLLLQRISSSSSHEVFYSLHPLSLHFVSASDDSAFEASYHNVHRDECTPEIPSEYCRGYIEDEEDPLPTCDALTELSEPDGSFASAGVADCTWKMPLEESHLIELHVTDIELQEGDYVDINWKWRDNHYLLLQRISSSSSHEVFYSLHPLSLHFVSASDDSAFEASYHNVHRDECTPDIPSEYCRGYIEDEEDPLPTCDALTELSEPDGSFASAGVADCTWKMPLEESHLIELHVTDIELQEGDYVDINWKWRDNHYLLLQRISSSSSHEVFYSLHPLSLHFVSASDDSAFEASYHNVHRDECTPEIPSEYCRGYIEDEEDPLPTCDALTELSEPDGSFASAGVADCTWKMPLEESHLIELHVTDIELQEGDYVDINWKWRDNHYLLLQRISSSSSHEVFYSLHPLSLHFVSASDDSAFEASYHNVHRDECTPDIPSEYCRGYIEDEDDPLPTCDALTELSEPDGSFTSAGVADCTWKMPLEESHLIELHVTDIELQEGDYVDINWKWRDNHYLLLQRISSSSSHEVFYSLHPLSLHFVSASDDSAFEASYHNVHRDECTPDIPSEYCRGYIEDEDDPLPTCDALTELSEPDGSFKSAGVADCTWKMPLEESHLIELHVTDIELQEGDYVDINWKWRDNHYLLLQRISSSSSHEVFYSLHPLSLHFVSASDDSAFEASYHNVHRDECTPEIPSEYCRGYIEDEEDPLPTCDALTELSEPDGSFASAGVADCTWKMPLEESHLIELHVTDIELQEGDYVDINWKWRDNHYLLLQRISSSSSHEVFYSLHPLSLHFVSASDDSAFEASYHNVHRDECTPDIPSEYCRGYIEDEDDPLPTCDALTELSEPDGSFKSAGVADCTWKMPLEESHLIELHVTDIELQEGDYVDINWKWRDNHYLLLQRISSSSSHEVFYSLHPLSLHFVSASDDSAFEASYHNVHRDECTPDIPSEYCRGYIEDEEDPLPTCKPGIVLEKSQDSFTIKSNGHNLCDWTLPTPEDSLTLNLTNIVLHDGDLIQVIEESDDELFLQTFNVTQDNVSVTSANQLSIVFVSTSPLSSFTLSYSLDLVDEDTDLNCQQQHVIDNLNGSLSVAGNSTSCSFEWLFPSVPDYSLLLSIRAISVNNDDFISIVERDDSPVEIDLIHTSANRTHETTKEIKVSSIVTSGTSFSVDYQYIPAEIEEITCRGDVDLSDHFTYNFSVKVGVEQCAWVLPLLDNHVIELNITDINMKVGHLDVLWRWDDQYLLFDRITSVSNYLAYSLHPLVISVPQSDNELSFEVSYSNFDRDNCPPHVDKEYCTSPVCTDSVIDKTKGDFEVSNSQGDLASCVYFFPVNSNSLIELNLQSDLDSRDSLDVYWLWKGQEVHFDSIMLQDSMDFWSIYPLIVKFNSSGTSSFAANHETYNLDQCPDHIPHSYCKSVSSVVDATYYSDTLLIKVLFDGVLTPTAIEVTCSDIVEIEEVELLKKCTLDRDEVSISLKESLPKKGMSFSLKESFNWQPASFTFDGSAFFSVNSPLFLVSVAVLLFVLLACAVCIYVVFVRPKQDEDEEHSV